VFHPRRILVAGPTSVTGRRVVAALAAGGDTVFGLARSKRSAEVVRTLGGHPVPGGGLDRRQVFAAFEEVRPDVVIHHRTAFPTTPLDALRPDHGFVSRCLREGSRNLAAAAEEYDVQRLLSQSIAFAYRPEGPWVVDESAPLDTTARGVWGEFVSALADAEENALAGRNYVGVVLRHGILYGPETDLWSDGRVSDLVRRRRLPIVGRGHGTQSFLHVDDAVGATLAALDHGSGIFNVVDDSPLLVREWVPALAEALRAPPPRRMPGLLARTLAVESAVRVLTTQRGAANARIRTELGWKPEYPDLRTGLAELRGAAEGPR
jgi:nucleoside-diphosphate-sugar epimerase